MTFKVRQLVAGFEYSFVIFVLIFATSPFGLFLSRGESPGSGNPLTQAMWLLVYGITFLLILPHLNRFAFVITRDPWMLALVAVTLLSFIWSEAPSVSLRRGVALAGTTMFVAYVVMRFDPATQIAQLAWAMGIAALLSMALVVILPEFGIDLSVRVRRAGFWWRGIYHQKAALGRYMSLGSIAFAILLWQRHQWRRMAWLGLGLTLLLLFFSTSRTSQVAFVMAIAVFIVGRVILWRRWPYTLVVPTMVIAAFGVGFVIFLLLTQLEFLTGLIDRTTTLTGRTLVWEDMVRLSAERPFLGYGYNGFWLGWNGPSAEVWTTRPWLPRYAHNGFLDLLIDLGWLGLGIFLIHYALMFGRAFWWARQQKTMVYLWPLAFFVYMLWANITDSSILIQNNLMWMLYVAASLTMLVWGKEVQTTDA